MHNNDNPTVQELRESLQQAIRDNDAEAFGNVFARLMERHAEDIRAEYQQQLDDARQRTDTQVLASRGLRQLTSDETTYYQRLADAMRSANPRQALTDGNLVMPETILYDVFNNLRTDHELLRLIDFQPTGGMVKMIMSRNSYQKAAWGKLCDTVVKEIAAGFAEVDTGLLKLTAFLPVCKSLLELGPEWLDRFVREVLYEALANGLEYGIVDGTGKDEPIGMTRQVGDDVVVTGGVYPKKDAIALKEITAESVGGLAALLAVDAAGKPRKVEGLVMVVNPQDYFERVMPATTVMAPDGTFRNNVTPYPMTILQSAALARNEAVFGMARQYFMAAGMGKDGRIECSDEYHFLEDERVYLAKLFANGLPKDDHAFLVLDISELRPLRYRVIVDTVAADTDATLSSLKIGSLTLSPAFDAEVTEYTAATENATNTITAAPTVAGASITIEVGDTEVANGAAATWAEGSNTVTVTVTAMDGVTQEVYTVTVTKS